MAFNWDTGAEELKQLLTHPLTDPATLLMAFWRSSPAFYLQYENNEDLTDDQKQSREFIEWCFKRLSRVNFAAAKLSYDPKNDHGHDMTQDYQRVFRKMDLESIKSQLTIPEVLIQAISSSN